MKRIYITGVESSGKTTLAKGLGNALALPVVPEFARCYLTVKEGSYQLADIEIMASTQQNMQESYRGLEPPAVICDTGPLVLATWAEVVFDAYPQGLRDYLEIAPDLVFIGRPDFAWEYDPLRENPRDREQLHQHYVKKLTELGWPYHELCGTSDDRLQRAIHITKEVLHL